MEYVLTFLEGIASFISPCILPMLPIYISYFAGKEKQKGKALINSIGFVLGFSIIFIIFAILANKIGMVLTNIINNIKILFGILIIILGLNYIEIIKIKFLNKIGGIQIKNKEFNFIKSVIFGILFSISLTPCIGTFLSSALFFIANQTTLIKGIILIILYCMGLGIPFIASSVLIEKLKNVFDFIKNNYKIIKIISGIILIIMGIYVIIK